MTPKQKQLKLESIIALITAAGFTQDRWHDLKIVVKILRKEYPGLTKDVSDHQLLNDIVTIFMARSFKSPSLQQMYDALDNI